MASLDNTTDRTRIVAPAGGVTAGTPIVLQDLPMVPEATAEAGANVVCVHRSMRRVNGWTKTTGETWAVGQRLYAIAATGLATTTVGTNKPLGFAATAQIAGDTTGDVYLDG